MRALGVVVVAPALDDDLRLVQAVEDLAVQEFVPQLCIEALAVAVLPWTARLDVGRPGADSGDPLPHRLRHELWAIVGPDVVRDAAEDELVGQHVDDVRGFQPPIDADRQALPRKLVDQVEHSELPSVMGSALDEVVGPDVIGSFWSQTDAGPVVEPEPPLLGLLLRHLSPSRRQMR